ncbi:phosphodiesterase [Candidatus Micrarchaeota archaeon CG_4_10_14_0_2_um_filter_49_7]|nr:MAG: hypothetical protein AUJ13_04235 [Candidatus Micrarchaeota archaeon CG1_02_49_24]PIZ93384.1 MAG: phosphodiesterase [Candidatus Micrarchaeota archaeon CG_4_10_14_0_2_um_filter_49_7]HII54325.1 HD domain-containing protein [Candidatus Micrarchaeota archaeon]
MAGQTHIIRDAVHRDIALTELELKIINTPTFQRLRRIKQLALAYMVYPSANHTRFEHSLGTMHLAGLLSRNLGFSEDAISIIRLQGLLHDVGHLAFSHESEFVAKEVLGTHEELGRSLIMQSELKDILSTAYSKSELQAIVHKEEKLITGDIGVDRMDYLVRDAYHTGVAYGVIDVPRIINTSVLHENELAIDIRGLESVEGFLIARHLMYSTVYMHKTVRILSAMLQRALSAALKVFDAHNLLNSSDDELLYVLGKQEASAEMVRRIHTRNLYKRAAELSYDKYKDDCRHLASELSQKCKFDFIVDIPHLHMGLEGVKVHVGGRLFDIRIVSKLVDTLEASERDKSTILFACDTEHMKALAAEIDKIV